MVVEHDVDLPRTIVWDALIDPDLVAGWLAEALIVPEEGGEYNLTWLDRVGRPQTFGRIVALQYPELLIVDTSNLGMLEFQLIELPGGMRGTSTKVRVEVGQQVGVEGDALLAERVEAQWQTSFARLEELLRGHPTDWAGT